MRHVAMVCTAVLVAWIAAYGCSVDVTGAPCVTDKNCPGGQFCGTDGLCTRGLNSVDAGRETGDRGPVNGDGAAAEDGRPGTDDGPDPDGGTGAEGPTDSGNLSDASDPSDSSDLPDSSDAADATPDAGCVPEDRLAFCARMQVECGPATGKDNCGFDRTEFCGGCSGCKGNCAGGKCVPASHAGAMCSADDVYWTDSCGSVEEKKDDCMGLQVCFDTQCCTPETCQSLGVECGTWDDACGKSIVCPACPSPFKCCKGKCCKVAYVMWNASGAKDGTSWKDAYLTIHEALAAAQPGNEVWVAKGTYLAEAGDLEAARVGENVRLFGGFDGVETALSERRLTPATETVIKGGTGVRGVVLLPGASIDGFTVTGAKITEAGGGIQVLPGPLSASVTISNCVIKSNEALTGGGVYVSDGTLAIDRTLISANRASDGGGIYNQGGTLKLSNSVISRNRAYGNQGGGGGMMNHQGDSEIANCLFAENTAEAAFGGGIYNVYPSTHTVVNSTFALNAAVNYGGAVFNNVQAAFDAANCIFWGDTPKEVSNFPSSGAVSKIRYSLISWSGTGEGNITGDPRFREADNDDFHLLAESPCIDAAEGAVAPPADMEGTARNDALLTPDSGKGVPPWADMGAFEYVCVPMAHAESRCDQGAVFWFNSCGVREEVKETCQQGQVCSGEDCCTPESAEELCGRKGLTCGEHVLTDGCGQTRTVLCGICKSGQRCCEGACATGDCCSDADCPGTTTSGDGGVSTTWQSTCYQNRCRTLCNQFSPQCMQGDRCCAELNFCVDMTEVCCTNDNDCLIPTPGKCCAGICDPVLGQECR